MTIPAEPDAAGARALRLEGETPAERYLRHVRNILAAMLALMIAGLLASAIAFWVAAAHAHAVQVRREESSCASAGGIWVSGQCLQ